VELTVTATPRPQESFWLPAHKLKPQRVTMLLLAVEKDVSWGLFFFFCLSFVRKHATRPGANHYAS
jgi:hypothetical protein